MSQAGIVDIEGSHPQIPTMFVTDSGTAIPIANTLEILGTVVAAHGIPLRTTGSGNTVTVQAQYASAAASSLGTNAGLASFSSTDFTVDPNGFVTFTNTGYVKSVSGTPNRITSTGGQNPIIDIAATYVGQTSITTLGTVTTGVWNGSTIGPTFGGTGINTYATGDILYASATNTLSKLPASSDGKVLTLASGIPSWATPATGTIQTINGDSGSITGSTVTIFANQAANNSGASVQFVNSGTTSTLNLTDASSNTLIGNLCGNNSVTGNTNSGFGPGSLIKLTSGGNNSSFGPNLTALTTGSNNTAVGLSSGAITSGSNNVFVGYGAGHGYTSSESSNIVIQSIGTTAGVTAGESNVIRIGVQGSGAGQQSTCYIAGITGVSVSNINVVTINTVTGQLGSQTLTSGTVTSVSGTANQVAVATGTTTPVISLIGPYTPATYTAHGTLIGQGTSSIVATATGTSGQVLTSNGASADPTYQTAATRFIWNVVSTNQTGATNNGYIFVSAGGALTVSLPTTSAVGDTFSVILDGATSWQITQASGQQIRISGSTTTSGATGSVTSTGQGDSLTLVCRVANTTWSASSIIGNLTVA